MHFGVTNFQDFIFSIFLLSKLYVCVSPFYRALQILYAILNQTTIFCFAVDDDAILMENDNLYLKIKRCLKSKGSALRELGEYIIEDVYKKELSTAFLDQVR